MKNALAVQSGTAAIHLALNFGCKQNDNVILPIVVFQIFL